MKTEDKITRAELSKRLGVSRAYITQLYKAGKLTVDSDGLLDFDQARKEIEAYKDFNRDPQRQAAEKKRKNNEVIKLQTELQNEIEKAQEKVDALVPKGFKYISIEDVDKLSTEQVGRETQKTKLIRETFEAMIRELEYYEKLGSLVSVDDILESNRKVAASIRNKLVSIPSNIAPKLEGLSVPQRQVLIEDTINNILTELNNLVEVHEKTA